MRQNKTNLKRDRHQKEEKNTLREKMLTIEEKKK